VFLFPLVATPRSSEVLLEHLQVAKALNGGLEFPLDIFARTHLGYSIASQGSTVEDHPGRSRSELDHRETKAHC
jgi:hypothetical protein